MGTSKGLFLIQPDHLFHPRYLKDHQDDLFLMIEDREQLSAYKFHKQRQVFYLSAMRHYAKELNHLDFNLVYLEFSETNGLSYEKILLKSLKESGITTVITFEIEDKVFEKRLQTFCNEHGYTLKTKLSPLFLNTRTHFHNFLEKTSKSSAKAFYEEQRRNFKVLIDPNGEPTGGQFSFAGEEQLKWSYPSSTPKIPISVHDEIDKKVIQLVDQEFPDNPGEALTAWYPVTREAAQETLEDFCKYRLPEHGPYDETFCPNEDFLFHSALAPLLNIGLLAPDDVLNTVLQYSKENPISLNSLESFVRKVLGHREYARGIYQNYIEFQENSNFWNHHRLPNENWYTGNTQVPPLDDVIHKALRLGYTHHAERLHVLCNMMNLSEIQPRKAYSWFMEMHLDSTIWALGPNLYGLGLHSDGGVFSSQFYISSSSDWLQRSTYEKADWCTEVDGLFWRFVEKHEDFLSNTPKLASLPKSLERIPADRKEAFNAAADAFLARNTLYP